MQSLAVVVLKTLWAALEPHLIPALVAIAKELAVKAKAGQFPDKYKAFEPAFDSLMDEIVKLLPNA